MTELEQQLAEALERMSVETTDALQALSQRLDALEAPSSSSASPQRSVRCGKVWNAWQQQELQALGELPRSSAKATAARLSPPCSRCAHSVPLLGWQSLTVHCDALHTRLEELPRFCGAMSQTQARVWASEALEGALTAAEGLRGDELQRAIQRALPQP